MNTKSKIDLNEELLKKYNIMIREVLDYYDIQHMVSINDYYGLTYFNIGKILSDEEFLGTTDDYLSSMKKKYPLLVPFYIISRNYAFGHFGNILTPETFKEANDVIQKIRKNKFGNRNKL